MKNNYYIIHKKVIFMLFCAIICIIFISNAIFALSLSDYKKYVDDGYIGIRNVDMHFNPKGQMYRKYGHFIIDGEYKGGNAENPFYNEENSRDLAVLAGDGDSTYDVYAEVEDDEIDYSYEDDETLTATDYNRAAFQAKLDAMYFGNTLHSAVGYGKYNLRAGKNLTAFIKFAYDFYRDQSGESRVGLKNVDMLKGTDFAQDGICPMEELEAYASKTYTDTNNATDGAFKDIWIKCSKHWDYKGDAMSEYSENIFETLQDIFMVLVYLKPGVKAINNAISGNQDLSKNYDIDDLDEADYAAILSMMYERFGGRPINPSKVDSGDAIPVVKSGDVLPALINFPQLTIAEKIYAYMIEIKYKNNDVKLASWLKEYEDVVGGEYTILDADTYDNFMKAYQVAYKDYGSETANDTLLDYGCVLTPDIFESKVSYEQALNKFANTIKSHFGDSNFYKNKDNANFVAKSYAMAKKMCENSAFSDITDIYACDLDVIEHSIGYESPCILLADTQVVELHDILTFGSDTDTDGDGLSDYKEAGVAEEVDISNFIIEYCKYNKYTEAETADMLAKNSKVTMYNYSSNPVLPDTDFDGRTDNRDGTKLSNKYKSKNQTSNYNSVNIEFCQDYRYFFMDEKSYYEDLAEMGLILSNMASFNKDGQEKSWVNTIEGYNARGLSDYMWYIGMEDIEPHIIKDIYSNELESVPYAFGHHDALALMGKVNNLEKNIVTLVIGENANYKDILASNYDGSFGIDGTYEGDHHHIGFDVEATKIYEKFIDYINMQGDGWKKAYWIVGYGTGGSIANLVAKKLIDEKGNREPVFCYTYQAPYTINLNNLSKRIYNEKYQSIYNIENSDDITLNLMGEKAGFSKYGIIKNLSVGDTKKASSAFKSMTGKAYQGNSNIVSNIIRSVMDGVSAVFGFDGTETNDLLDTLLYIRYESTLKYLDSIGENVEIYLSINPETKERASFIANKYYETIKKDGDMASSQAVMVNNPYTILNIFLDQSMRSGNEGKPRFIKTVEDMSMWYLNHVSTYQNGSNSDKATNLAYNYYNDNKDSYYYTGSVVLSDTRSYKYIKTIGSKKGYFYEKFLNYDDSEDKVGGIDYNSDSQYVGNDCSGFIQAIIYTFRGGNDQSVKRGKGNGSNGLRNHNESASNLTSTTATNTQQAMYNLGYERIPVTNETSISTLHTGDILSCSAHTEIFVGDQYDRILDEYESTQFNARNDAKKELEWTDDMFEKSGEVTFENNKAYGTFGWGNVMDEFPAESATGVRHYFYKSPDEAFFRHCECGNEPDAYAIIRKTFDPITNKTIENKYIYKNKAEAESHMIADDEIKTAHEAGGCNFDTRQYTAIWRR